MGDGLFKVPSPNVISIFSLWTSWSQVQNLERSILHKVLQNVRLHMVWYGFIEHFSKGEYQSIVAVDVLRSSHHLSYDVDAHTTNGFIES